MLTLKFKLLQNKKELIKQESNYFKKDNSIHFKIDDYLYTLDIKEKSLTKTDENSSIIITPHNIEIILRKEGYHFNMPTEVLYEITSQKIKIEYTLPDEDNNTNCIIIEL